MSLSPVTRNGEPRYQLQEAQGHTHISMPAHMCTHRDILAQQQQWLPWKGIKDSTPWSAFRTSQGSPLQAIPVSLLNSPPQAHAAARTSPLPPPDPQSSTGPPPSPPPVISLRASHGSSPWAQADLRSPPGRCAHGRAPNRTCSAHRPSSCPRRCPARPARHT